MDKRDVVEDGVALFFLQARIFLMNFYLSTCALLLAGYFQFYSFRVLHGGLKFVGICAISIMFLCCSTRFSRFMYSYCTMCY